MFNIYNIKITQPCIVIMLLIICPLYSYAQQENNNEIQSIKSTGKLPPDRIDTDRPDQTESSTTTPFKYFQVELGFNRESYKDGTIVYVQPAGLYKYGISRKAELRVEAPIITELPTHPEKQKTGFEPVEIGAKVALFEEKKWIPKTSVIAHVGLPFAATKEYQPANPSFIFRFTCQNTISKVAGIGYNVGVSWDGDNSNPVYFYTFSPGFNIGKSWYAYVEAFGFVAEDKLPDHNLALGAAYYINNDVKIDISGACGLDKAMLHHYVAIGLSFRFKALK